ncbi:hypothetical protein SAMN05444161_4653 [Rhizobiales bacterium GAS191]|nr:hypothetical protein SAMN05444161_4653 [Rhizobiales bacterium GAS191]
MGGNLARSHSKTSSGRASSTLAFRGSSPEAPAPAETTGPAGGSGRNRRGPGHGRVMRVTLKPWPTHATLQAPQRFRRARARWRSRPCASHGSGLRFGYRRLPPASIPHSAPPRKSAGLSVGLGLYCRHVGATFDRSARPPWLARSARLAPSARRARLRGVRDNPMPRRDRHHVGADLQVVVRIECLACRELVAASCREQLRTIETLRELSRACRDKKRAQPFS